MSKNLVSVIIPTYKREAEMLRRAVESVLAQTYPDVQIVIIDDSPDDFAGRAAVKEYVEGIASDAVIFHQNEVNLGGSFARNKGIELATGDFITFLDDDDEYLPEKIERQLEFMIAGDYDMTLTKMVLYNTEGTSVVDVRDHSDVPSWDNDTLLRWHIMHHLTGTPTFMYKADKLREIGGFDAAIMGQEFFLMLKTIERGLKIGYFDECGVKVYRQADSISFGKNKLRGEEIIYEHKKKYFDRLSPKEIRYVKFRHRAIKAIVYRRQGSYLKMAGAALSAVATSPGAFFSEIASQFKKVQDNS